jgi:6-phosphogluconolactonase (cycloisomerase 2 family)
MQRGRLAFLVAAAIVVSSCGGDGGSSGGGPQMYAVGGTLSGVQYDPNEAGDGQQLILFDNGADAISHPANGKFTFSGKLAAGASYNVTAQVSLLLPYQTCKVSNGTGTAGASSVTAVTIVCTTASFTLSGTVSGLLGGGLVLSDGSESLAVSANGAFHFTKPLSSGTRYAIAVATPPSGPSQTCSITTSNQSGQVTTAGITGIQVVCNTNSFGIGGTVSGLTGTGLSLSVSATNTLSFSPSGTLTATVPVTANGSFAVPEFFMATGYQYVVSAGAMPAGQTCLVPNGAGTTTTASVMVTVVCAAPRFAYAAGIHPNDVLGYSVNFTNGSLTALPGSPYSAGGTTNAVVLDPTDHFLFAAGSNTISVYSIDAGTGALTPVAGSPFTAATVPVSLAVAPSGHYLYAADGQDNTVSEFAIGSTGALTPVAGGPVVAGIDGPRALTILPNGAVLYLSSSNDKVVYSYAVDGSSGALTALPGSPLAAPGGPGPVQLLLGVQFATNSALASWVDTAPVRGLETLSQDVYALDPVTGALDTTTNYGETIGNGGLSISDFEVADPEGQILYLVGRQTHTGNDEIQTYCYGLFCRMDGLFPTNAQITGAAVDPSGRFLYLTDNAGNALPFIIDRIGATLVAGTPTPGAFSPYRSVVFTTQ